VGRLGKRMVVLVAIQGAAMGRRQVDASAKKQHKRTGQQDFHRSPFRRSLQNDTTARKTPKADPACVKFLMCYGSGSRHKTSWA
jgi:hypothetical protein